MRKVVVLEARPGMVLHAPVAAQDGEVVFPAARVLAEGDLDVLTASGATEIEIEDVFAAPARALFPPHIEAAAPQALNAIILLQPGPGEPLYTAALHKLIGALDELVESAGPELDGEADFAGPDTLQGHDYVHPVKVAELSIVLARALRMHPARLRDLALAAALMNVGYAALRRSLLDEPRALEEHEWQHHVSMHPEYSRRIVSESGLSQEALDAIEQHHERWDGSGYPHGCKGGEINEFGRIIAIADTYVSLRSRRAYRNAVSHAEAVELLQDGAGDLFDPDLVRLFVDVTTRLIPRDQHSVARSTAAASSIAAAAPSARAVEDATTEGGRDAHSPDVAGPTPDEERVPDRQPAPVSMPIPRRSSAHVARAIALSRVEPPPPVTRLALVAAAPATARRQPFRTQPRRRRSLWSPSLYLESVGAKWGSTPRR